MSSLSEGRNRHVVDGEAPLATIGAKGFSSCLPVLLFKPVDIFTVLAFSTPVNNKETRHEHV